MDAMISMNVIRRAGVFIAAAVVAPIVALAASGCGAGTSTGGLENKSSAEVLQDAVAALSTAKSVYITGSPGSSPVGSHLRIKGKTLRIKGESLRIQGDSLTLAVTLTGGSAEITSIGGDTYLKADQVGLKMLGAPGQCNATWPANGSTYLRQISDLIQRSSERTRSRHS
jgi:hypothetical protein